MKKALKENLYHGAVAFILFLLTQNAARGGPAPIPVGLFAGLTIAGWNVFCLAPAFLLASVVALPTVEGLLVGLLPGVIFSAACVVKRAGRKNLSPAEAALCSAVVAAMRFLVVPADLTDGLVYVVLCVALSYASVVAMYAVLVRGVGYRLSADEKVCLAIMVGALTFGVKALEVGGITPYYAACAAACVYVAYAFSGEGVIFAFAMGVAGGDTTSVCAVVAWFMAAYVFSKHSRIMASAALVISDVLVTALTGGVAPIRLICVAVGALVVCLIPSRVMADAVAFFGTLSEAHAARSLVNRNRADVKDKIKGVSAALSQAEALCGEEPASEDLDEVKVSLCAELEARFCDGCPGKRGCHKLLGGSAMPVLSGVVDSALCTGRATVLDLPPYLTGSCARVDALTDTVNGLIGAYKGRLAVKRNAGATRRLVASVMTGMAKMMDEIAESLGVSLGFDADRETKMADELNYVGVATDGISVYGEGRGIKVCVVTRESDESKPSLVRAVGKTVGLPMCVTDRKELDGGRSEVWLAPAPTYEVVLGCASAGLVEGACGDTTSATRLSDGRCLIALSDGMGAGRRADEQSAGLLAIVERFMRAGFSSESVLPVVNKLMLLGGTESFQTLDLAIVDTVSGNADVIKMGACESLLVRAGEVKVIEGAALPVGILDEVHAHVDRVRLAEGDVLVTFSDGLIDTLGAEDVRRRVAEGAGLNPQTLCEGLVARAKSVGLKDDVSVMATRIFRAR